MEIIRTNLNDCLVFKPDVYKDDRGFFYENRSRKYSDLGLPEFVGTNTSVSSAGVLRGLHFQKAPYEQGKLVECLRGKILDVAVDLRPGSSTYGQHYKVFLCGASRENPAVQLWIPPGFAHGFLAFVESQVSYHITAPYHPEAESGIAWDDPTLNIDWKLQELGIKKPLLSEKDQRLPKWEK